MSLDKLESFEFLPFELTKIISSDQSSKTQRKFYVPKKLQKQEVTVENIALITRQYLMRTYSKKEVQSEEESEEEKKMVKPD